MRVRVFHNLRSGPCKHDDGSSLVGYTAILGEFFMAKTADPSPTRPEPQSQYIPIEF